MLEVGRSDLGLRCIFCIVGEGEGEGKRAWFGLAAQAYRFWVRVQIPGPLLSQAMLATERLPNTNLEDVLSTQPSTAKKG